MYKIPKDIEIEMNKLYPDLDIQLFIHNLFTKVLDKTFADGACTIRELGKFITYKTYSTKVNNYTVKLKFKTAASILNRIRHDEYLLENVPVQSKYCFTDSHKQACQNRAAQKAANKEIASKVKESEHKKTNERLAKYEILKVLEEKDNK
jgi:hypothetical protein